MSSAIISSFRRRGLDMAALAEVWDRVSCANGEVGNREVKMYTNPENLIWGQAGIRISPLLILGLHAMVQHPCNLPTPFAFSEVVL